MPIEKREGGRGSFRAGRSSGDEPREATTGRDKSFACCKDAGDGEETGGGASPLKLYLGQILLAAANLSSAAHTNRSSGSIRASGAPPRGWGWLGFHLLGLMHAWHKGALREATEDLKLQEAHCTWVHQQREGAWRRLPAPALVMLAC